MRGGESEAGEVDVELLLELFDVVDSLIKASGELGCDGLNRDALVGGSFVSDIAGGLWFGVDDLVLAVGLVPGGGHGDPEFLGGAQGLKLNVGKTIADADGEFSVVLSF